MPEFRLMAMALAGVTLMLLVSACGGDLPLRPPSPYVVRFSPNGEPMTGGPRGYPPCEQAQARWLAEADRDRNGVITRDEFLADARRQFKVMDLDGNGEITPSELADYRAPFATPPKGAPSLLPADAPEGAIPRRPLAGPISDTMPDPVMIADTELRFRVSLPAFLASADRQFLKLGGAQGTPLGADVVAQLCLEPELPSYTQE